MRKRILTVVFVSLLAVLLLPARTDAYGAAHVGYTRMTPYGVYHTGRTAVAGPYGGYAGGHTTAYGYGGAYRGGYGVGYGAPGYDRYGAASAYGIQSAYGAAVQSHVYAPGYYNAYGYYR